MLKVFLPGFGLKPSMYSRLDLQQNSSCIDLNVEATLDETIAGIIDRAVPGSVAIGYSMGARLALASALREPNHFRGLVLISMNAGISDIKERADRKLKDEALIKSFNENTETGFSILDSSDVFESDKRNAEFIKENRIESSELITKQIKVLGLGQFDSLEGSLMDLRIPVLYISGSRDLKYSALNSRYKKQTPFSHHRILDSDHRVPICSPRTLSLQINWFTNNVI